MREAPSRQAVLVGLFVAFGIAILAGGVFTIGDREDSFSSKIRLTATFDDVKGLQEGGNIWYSGLKVGTVRGLDFTDGAKVVVDMRVEREASTFIRKDTQARIGSDGLIGNRIVVLVGGTAQAEPVGDGDALPVGQTVSTEEVIEMVQENNQNLLDITTDLKVVTAALASGQGTLGRLLEDPSLYTDASKTMRSLERFTGKLNAEGSLPNDLVTDRQLYGSLATSAAHLEEATGHAAALAETLEQGAATPESLLGTVVGDEEAGEDLRDTLSSLDEASRLLAEDLEALQHSFLLRRYFKKKEKERARTEEQAPEPLAVDEPR